MYLLWTTLKLMESWYAFLKWQIPLTPHTILLHNISIWFSIYALFFKLNFSICLYNFIFENISKKLWFTIHTLFCLKSYAYILFSPFFSSFFFLFLFLLLFIFPSFLLFFLLWDSAFIPPALYFLYHFIIVTWCFLFLYTSDSQLGTVLPSMTFGDI